MPLDGCLYALRAAIPHSTRSSLHRCLQRRGVSRPPETEGDKPGKRKFKAYPLGYFHIGIAEVHTEQGRLYLLVAIDRTSKFALFESRRGHQTRSVHACAGLVRARRLSRRCSRTLRAPPVAPPRACPGACPGACCR